jgi:hypothetical protein
MSELGENGGRGKIQALHSSSALVCNFFDYWRAGCCRLIVSLKKMKRLPGSRLARQR